MHDSVAFQNIAETVQELDFGQLVQGEGRISNRTVLAVVSIKDLTDFEGRVASAVIGHLNADDTRMLTGEADGVVVALEGFVAGKEEGETGAHSHQVGVVVHVHLVCGRIATVVDGPLHDLIGSADVRRTCHRFVFGGTIDLVHQIDDTVVGEQARFNVIDIILLEHLYLRVMVAQRYHLTGNGADKAVEHDDVQQG